MSMLHQGATVVVGFTAPVLELLKLGQTSLVPTTRGMPQHPEGPCQSRSRSFK